jgi:hypothetical protein
MAAGIYCLHQKGIHQQHIFLKVWQYPWQQTKPCKSKQTVFFPA